ncbi:hypothetical protein SSX86_019745 [Deinandra increscens subsp. villosa]|uniref:Bifunctional inhibitor/plant lipid transfer protein/seed storage helical domain-containing protein n=1 Tax=Deinandra increscens subsp. villosa TaxID=3103831 RepID=A0AAP0D0E5_9ASTR
MASSGYNPSHLGLAFVLLTLWWGGSMGQSGCTSVLIGMAPCLNYVTGSSKTPTSSCCSSLANVVKSQPQCLCTALDGKAMASLGISINKTVALSLPHACNVKTPPVSRCNAGNNAPMMAPIKSPEDDESPNGPSPSSIFSIGSKQVISNGETSDDGGGNKGTRFIVLSSILVMLVLLS